MSGQKSRHGCLTAWLVLMIVMNSAVALFYLVAGDVVKQALPSAPKWTLPVLIIAAAFNLVCAIALWRWKKWGFWGFVLSSIVGLIVNLSIGIGAQSVVGLVGVAILYGVLQIGQENKGWPQLE